MLWGPINRYFRPLSSSASGYFGRICVLQMSRGQEEMRTDLLLFEFILSLNTNVVRTNEASRDIADTAGRPPRTKLCGDLVRI
jgi:hypothetical protein